MCDDVNRKVTRLCIWRLNTAVRRWRGCCCYKAASTSTCWRRTDSRRCTSPLTTATTTSHDYCFRIMHLQAPQHRYLRCLTRLQKGSLAIPKDVSHPILRWWDLQLNMEYGRMASPIGSGAQFCCGKVGFSVCDISVSFPQFCSHQCFLVVWIPL